MNSYLLTETFYCFCLVCLLLISSLFQYSNEYRVSAGAGFGLGLTSLVKPGLQYFFIPIAALFATHTPQSKLKVVGIFILIFSLVFGAWAVRKFETIGKTSDPTLKNNFLHHGLYPDFIYDGDPRSGEIAFSINSSLEEIWRRFNAQPVTYAKWLLYGKPREFWG